MRLFLHAGEVFQGAGNEDRRVVRAFVRIKRVSQWSGQRAAGGLGQDFDQLRFRFGIAFGTAYQLYDDCVDLFGSEAVAGKSLGTDLAKGKLTLPVLLLWERAESAERGRLRELVEGWQPASMKQLAKLLARHDTLEASLGIVRQYLQRARQALPDLPASGGRDALMSLTDYLARQTDALGNLPESSL